MKGNSSFQIQFLQLLGNEPAKRFTVFFTIIFILFFPFEQKAQNADNYDEVLVYLNIQRIGGAEIPSLIKGQDIYLPVMDLFDFLKIKNRVSPHLDSITGFFLNPSASYLIDRNNNQIIFQDKMFQLKPVDIIVTESNLYLKSNYFGQIFGLVCTFDFRSLSVNLQTDLELPIIREMRQEQMRNNISGLTGEVKVDTVVARENKFFHFGMADWSVISTQQINDFTTTRANLALGGVFAWGETDISLYYNSDRPFTERDQYYIWKYVNNKNKYLRQSMVGKIPTRTVATLYAPVIGALFTNTPTTFRRSFGTYTLSDHTKPGWIVELYVNNVLVNYVKADASGFFSFEVPLVYGNTSVKLRFYGPWGEELAREENIVIPFNFLPAKEFEYNVSAGMVEDSSNSLYSNANVNYGLSRSVTIGGGAEYLSSVTSGEVMPYVNLSARIFSNLLFSGIYTYGVGSKAVLTYRRPNNLLFELSYTGYEKGQTAVNFYYLQDRKVMVSIPFRGTKFSAYTKLTYDYYVMPISNYSTAEWLISSSFHGISANLTTYGLFLSEVDPSIYSNLSLSFNLPWKIIFTPQVQFDYTQNAFISAKAGLEKRIFGQGYATLSYEDIFRSNFQIFQFGLRYDFSFAQAGFTFWNTKNGPTLVESARGSVMMDTKSAYVGTTNRSSVTKGGIVVTSFLDLNANGVKDAGEPKIAGLNLSMTGGRIKRSEKDSSIRIFDLEPYTDYLIEIDRNSFDNISWQIKDKTMLVAVEPNQFRHIDVPVSVMGEASGTVYNEENNGQARIIICIYNQDSALVARQLTEFDGYFNYLGLKPGNYTISLDKGQLEKLNMASSPQSIPFTIHESEDGDMVDWLEFRLKNNPTESIDAEITDTVQKKDESQIIHEDIMQTNSLVAEGKVSVQFGAFKKKENAVAMKEKIQSQFGKQALIIYGNDIYKVIITGFDTQQSAKDFLKEAKKQGFENAFILNSIPIGKIE